MVEMLATKQLLLKPRVGMEETFATNFSQPRESLNNGGVVLTVSDLSSSGSLTVSAPCSLVMLYPHCSINAGHIRMAT